MATSDDTAREAYVTLATNDVYAHGVLALGESLRRTGTTREKVAMLTKGVSEDMRTRIGKLWRVKLIEEMHSGDRESLALIQRPELGVTFSKLHVWRLTEYSKCVFLDADTLVLSNVDELFEREEFSAAPDIGWPDLFNSGVFVMSPSIITYGALVELAKREGSYDGGDQGLLNTYWNEWGTGDTKYRLPFVYNVVANLTYSYPPAIKRFFKDIKIVHFLGSMKPWSHQYDRYRDEVVFRSSSEQYAAEGFVKKWWQVYCSALPVDPTSQSSEESVPVSIETTVATSEEQKDIPSDEARKILWERGQPDYYGADQSDKIIEHISKQLKDF